MKGKPTRHLTDVYFSLFVFQVSFIINPITLCVRWLVGKFGEIKLSNVTPEVSHSRITTQAAAKFLKFSPRYIYPPVSHFWPIRHARRIDTRVRMINKSLRKFFQIKDSLIRKASTRPTFASEKQKMKYKN